MESIEKAVREFHSRVAALELVIDDLDAVFDMPPDCALKVAAWHLIESYKNAIGVAHHIDGWLGWWWLDCGLGKNPLEASPAGGESRVIATIDDLVRLVCEDLNASAGREN